VNVKKQALPSLVASNRKLINESEIKLFLLFNNSAHISEFVDFAKGKNAATCHVFSIKE